MGTAVEEDGMAEVGTVEREPLSVSGLGSGCLVGLWRLLPTMQHPITRLGQPDGISPSRMAEMLEVDKAGPKVRC